MPKELEVGVGKRYRMFSGEGSFGGYQGLDRKGDGGGVAVRR